jgi:starvation-inducible DNA-binding protein
MERRHMSLNSQWDLGQEAARDIAASLNVQLADAFSLLLKTKSCRWHVSGPDFQSHQSLLRALEEQIDAAIDDIAERIRRIGAAALSSIVQAHRLRRLVDSDIASLSALEMLAVLREDNLQLVAYLREAHCLCEGYGDVATASRLEKWIDDAEGRVRRLFAASRSTHAPDTATP